MTEREHTATARAHYVAAERCDARAAKAAHHGHVLSAQGFSAMAEHERKQARAHLAAAAGLMRQSLAEAIGDAQNGAMAPSPARRAA